MRAFDIAAIAATPWKNGGGSTREIACWPPGAGLDDFGWRVSIATIAAPGPFSVFPGVDRSIMLLDGAGVRLVSADGKVDHRLDAAHVPFAFDGAAEVDCRVIDGPTTDFNVMTRRGRFAADVDVLHSTADIALSGGGLVLSLNGRWTLRTHAAVALPMSDGEGFWWQGEPVAWHAEAVTQGAAMVVVRLAAAPAEAEESMA